MPLLCCDVGLISELRLTAGCVLMDLASPAVSGTSVYANGLMWKRVHKFHIFQGLCNGVDPLDFTINVRERLYIMKRIMEEMFPTIKSACL